MIYDSLENVMIADVFRKSDFFFKTLCDYSAEQLPQYPKFDDPIVEI
jgi:hypothetical protein